MYIHCMQDAAENGSLGHFFQKKKISLLIIIHDGQFIGFACKRKYNLNYKQNERKLENKVEK